jgi:hypothetical protein
MNEEFAALCRRLMDAKEQEKQATTARVAIEEQIIAMVGVKPEGSTTVSDDAFKVTTTGAVTRKVTDWDVFTEIPSSIAEQLVKTTHSLNTAGYRAVEKLHPEVIKQLSKGITTTPRKPSVKVVEL